MIVCLDTGCIGILSDLYSGSWVAKRKTLWHRSQTAPRASNRKTHTLYHLKTLKTQPKTP